MFKTILILICLCILANYIILHIKAISTDKEIENDQNFWMFTYDFKEKKRESIFDKEPDRINLFRWLSYCQFKFEEIKNGFAWKTINNFQI